MKPIKEVLSAYASLYRAAKDLGVAANQLKRWLDAGALVDDYGHVWIRTSKKPLRVWPDSDERIDNIGVNGPTGCHYQSSEYLK